MNRWFAAIPLVLFLGLAALGASELMKPEKPEFESVHLRPAPTNVFPLLNAEGVIAFAPPPQGQTIAVNLFASWCAPCRAEHPLLTQLASDHPGQVYGLAYKDLPEDTLGFLTELGDPFEQIGVDRDGQGGLEFGLTGVPETFVINPQGQVTLHVRGAITDENIDQLEGALRPAR